MDFHYASSISRFSIFVNIHLFAKLTINEICQKREKSSKKYVENALKSEQTQQESKVEYREFKQISAYIFGVQRGIFAEGYKRGERCYKRACAAYIYAEQKLAVVSREIGKENSRGHVAYKLAGKRREHHRVHAEQVREKVAYGIYARHIAGKDKEGAEC